MRAGLAAALIATASLTALGGCGGEEPSEERDSDVSVVLNKDSVAPGEELTARVRNRSAEQVTYGLAYRLQREVDGEFTEVELPDRAVIQIALVANPGETGPPVSVEIPADADPGRWRVILAPAGGDDQLSAEFDVE